MKRILIISPFKIYPTYSGFSTRVYNIIKELSNKNIIFFLYVDLIQKKTEKDNQEHLINVKKYPIKTSLRFMQLFHPMLLKKGFEIIKKENIDLIIAEGIWAGLHSMILYFLTKVPYYFTEHNVEYIRWKRMGKYFYNILKIYEKCCCNLAKKVICVSETDQKLIYELGIDINKIVVIPNGVDIQRFKPYDNKNEIRQKIRQKLFINNSDPIILFSGELSYIPNFQAVRIIREVIIDKVLKRISEAKFLIIGSNPPLKYNHNSIIFTGNVDRIEDYINASDVVIAPLTSGGGTKLKIVEAIACGKVVITTSIGAEGLISNETKDFLKVHDEWNEFTDAIISTLNENRKNIPPKEFIEKFSWIAVSEKLNKIINEER